MGATTTTRKVFRVLGTTDEVTECELCGRQELKGTVMLGILDDDSNVEEVVHYGSSCGAKAAGWTTKFVRDEAKAADKARRAAERAAADERHSAWIAARDTWIAANVGPNAMQNPRRYGFTGPVAVVQHYIDTTGTEWP